MEFWNIEGTKMKNISAGKLRRMASVNKVDKEGTSSLSASMKALYNDMVARGYPPSTTTTNTRVKVK